nr:signal peptidase I [Saprospiraceae bacterium]
MSVLIFLIVYYLLLSVSLYFLFPKCGREATNGLIPGLNFAVWAEIVGRKRWHALWLLFPIVNFFIFFGLVIDMARSFGRLSLLDSTLAVLFGPFYFFYLTFTDTQKYEGPILLHEREYKSKIDRAKEEGKDYQVQKLESNNPYRKSVGREWIEAAVFSIFVAAFIRMFMVEAFTIPTSSMEGSLLVGDYLFVSKMHYGLRTPMTVVQVPLLHNRIPFFNTESYLKRPQLPYFRFGKFQEIERGDMVVFNWPAGDSIYLLPHRSYSVSQIEVGPEESKSQFRNMEVIHRPVDKTDFYIKRCVGLPGTVFEMREGKVYIDGKAIEEPEKLQFRYRVQTGVQIAPSTLDRLDISMGDHIPPNIFHLNDYQVDALRSLDNSIKVERMYPGVSTPQYLFPHDPENFPDFGWDNYGPIPIPAEGETVALDQTNIALYRRIINVYEDNDLEIRDDEILINGEVATTYTFKQNYYWMVGDNRHNSEDSRVWGYVPEDHIVGKPLFIFFSTKNANMGDGIRWDRIFKSASDL